MFRHLHLMVLFGTAGLSAVLVACLRPASHEPQPAEPARVHSSDLPPAVYRHGEYLGRPVRIGFPRPLTPTADPLVWHYHPGEPPAVVLATYRLHFTSPPPAGVPLIVVGTVAGVEADNRIRLNGVPGVVVLHGCRVPPGAPESP